MSRRIAAAQFLFMRNALCGRFLSSAGKPIRVPVYVIIQAAI